jgi:COP9 signalosome complex subunit 3
VDDSVFSLLHIVRVRSAHMASSSSQNVTLDRVLLEITSSNSLGALNQTLRGFAPKDVRETLLASTLPNGQDPLGVLDIQRHTLGALYILYVLDWKLDALFIL